MPWRIGPRVKGIGVAFGIAIVTLALADVLLQRFVKPEALGFASPHPLFRFHSSLLFHLNPSLPGTQLIGGVCLYGPSLRPVKPAFRVLVLGDSYSQSSEDDPGWPSEMRRLLRRADLRTKIEIVNSAAAGYSTWQELRAMEILQPQVHADLVLGTWVTNDGTDEHMYVGEGLALPFPGDPAKLHRLKRPVAGPISVWLLEHSRLVQLGVKAGLWWDRPGPNSSAVVGPPFHVQPANLPSSALSHHLRLLRDLEEAVEDSGALYRQVLFGLMVQNYPRVAHGFERRTGADATYLLSFGPQSFLAQNVPWKSSPLNVTVALGASTHPTLIWNDYGHFATLGHRRVASLILRWLLPDLPVTAEEAETLSRLLDEEDAWYQAVDQQLCQAQFSRLPDGSFQGDCLLPEALGPVKEVYLRVNGTGEGQFRQARVSQNEFAIHEGAFGRWDQPEVPWEEVPRSAVITLQGGGRRIRVTLSDPSFDSLTASDFSLTGGAARQVSR